ncbi:MAG: DNA damage-inducible protein D [Ktedonobacterales bacterium]
MDEQDQQQSEQHDTAREQFESIKQISPYGAEYWSARELAPLLGYKNWERVPDLIERAKAACSNAGQEVDDHFRGASKMVTIGSKAQREVEDYLLSRFGCYLFAMNGDPRKSEIASAQVYFAVQTRRMEQWDEMREALAERVERRQQLADANKQLNALAQQQGVNSRSFGRLHDAGARGLYGGMGVREVKQYKGIGASEDLADRMGPAELAANLFVRTQTTEKIRNEQIRGQESVIDAHYAVGDETRQLIDRIGGTPPEDLPPEPSIRPLLNQQARHQRRLSAATSSDAPTLFDNIPDPASKD